MRGGEVRARVFSAGQGALLVAAAIIGWGCDPETGTDDAIETELVDKAEGGDPSGPSQVGGTQDPFGGAEGIAIDIVGGSLVTRENELLPDFQSMLPKDLPAGTALIDIGPLSVSQGRSQEVRITIPEDVHTLVLVALGPDGSLTGLDYFGRSGEEPIVSELAFSDSPDINRSVAITNNGVGLIPNSPEVRDLSAGTYSMVFAEYMYSGFQLTRGSTPVYAYALARRHPRQETGNLNMTFHFTGAGGLSAATAPQSPVLNQAVEKMREVYAQVGIQIAEIDYHDIPGAVQTVSLGNACNDLSGLGDLMQAATAGKSSHLNMVFVGGFTCPQGGGIAGISTGIPGLPNVKGAPNSGVAVSTQVFMADPVTTAVTMAHEAGHFLGLFHAQEQGGHVGGGGSYDAIADTPNDPSLVTDNLMFFAAASSAAVLSPGQGFVLRNNPLIVPTDSRGEPLR